MTFFDSHAHYNDRRFRDEVPGGADTLLCGLFSQNVCGIVNVGTNPATNAEVVAQAAKWPHMYAAVGYHPEDCHYFTGSVEENVAVLAAWLTPASREANKIVALGEIGLDYHYETYGENGEIPLDKEKEKAYFRAQLALARDVNVPVIVHDREAHGDTVAIIGEYPGVVGVMHSFSGSAETAQELCRMGWYISFSGTVTFNNAHKVREAAAAVPRDRILIETDCPYLSPVPLRGSMNHSGNLCYTAAAVAQAQGITVEEAAAVTADNACRFFRIKNE